MKWPVMKGQTLTFSKELAYFGIYCSQQSSARPHQFTIKVGATSDFFSTKKIHLWGKIKKRPRVKRELKKTLNEYGLCSNSFDGGRSGELGLSNDVENDDTRWIHGDTGVLK